MTAQVDVQSGCPAAGCAKLGAQPLRLVNAPPPDMLIVQVQANPYNLAMNAAI